MAKAVNFKTVEKFQKYLGSFVDEEPRSRKIFEVLYEQLQSKLEGWKTKFLSQSARTVLIKSILSSMPLYHLSYFKLTEKEANKCDSILNNFFWGNHPGSKSPHMKDWQTICRPISQGGLDIKRMSAFNNAMLGRQAWRIIHHRDCLLSKVYHAKYQKNRFGISTFGSSQTSPLARHICTKINEMIQDCRWRIGNGHSIALNDLLWITPDHDPDDISKVSQLIGPNGDWDTTMVRSIYSDNLANRILTMPTSHTGIKDRIVWTRNYSGTYSVKDAYALSITSQKGNQSNFPWKEFWKVQGLPKIRLFGWKCINNALPLGANLLKKNFRIDATCAFGCNTIEDDNHLFLVGKS